jgi:serine/threonine protein kinase
MTERPGTVDGRRIGSRYRMGAPLAAGGMGEVWVARDLLLDRPVAVKVLGGALAGDGRAAERLRREARAAARLDHPNIARVLGLGEHDGRPYLVMELLEGESWPDGSTAPVRWRRARRPGSWRRSPTRSRRPTARGSSTATSSRATSS